MDKYANFEREDLIALIERLKKHIIRLEQRNSANSYELSERRREEGEREALLRGQQGIYG